MFPESSHSLVALESSRKIDDDNEDATLTPLFAPSAGNLYFVKIMQIVYGNFYWTTLGIHISWLPFVQPQSQDLNYETSSPTSS